MHPDVHKLLGRVRYRRFSVRKYKLRDFAVRIISYAFLLFVANNIRADVWVERMLETKEHDFGTLVSGADAVWRFPISNIYSHKIELVGVRSSCGCTTASLENKQLEPGKTGYVVAQFNTRLNPGAHNAVLTVQTSWDDNGSKRTGEATLMVRGDVRASVAVEPNEINFANVSLGTTHERKVRVSTGLGSIWRIKNVQCSCENLNAEVPAPLTSREGVVYDVLVRLNERTPPGPVCEQLLLVTNDFAKPQIPIPVSGRVVPQLWASPELLFMGEVGAGEKISKKILVRSSRPCQISVGKSDNKDFQFKTENPASTRHVVEISFKRDEAGELKELIPITSDTGDSTSITAFVSVIPVRRP